MEEALYDSVSMRRFAGIDLGEMPVPDESTVCPFRHLLEAQGLGEKLFQRVHGYLERQGIKIGTGTILDATIISASPSTKNKDKRRDPEMRQTKNGNQWYFGMKAHIGVDSQTIILQVSGRLDATIRESPHRLPKALVVSSTAVPRRYLDKHGRSERFSPLRRGARSPQNDLMASPSLPYSLSKLLKRIFQAPVSPGRSPDRT